MHEAEDRIAALRIARESQRMRMIRRHDDQRIRRIGVFEREKRYQQRVTISVELDVEDGYDGKSDRLEHVLDYDMIVDGISEIVQREHLHLIETLAERIAAFCLSDARVRLARVKVEKPDALPAVRGLLYTLLLAEFSPPKDSDPQNALFLARIDKLLDLGALEPALALLEMLEKPDPESFRRWFDVSLLVGEEERARRIRVMPMRRAATTARRRSRPGR